MKILIIDDDKKFTDTLKDDVIKFFQRIDDKAIITVINENFRQVDLFNNYHIVFLDIDLLTDNGLTIAKQLRELDSNAMIIFVSSRSNLVFKTFVVNDSSSLTAFILKLASINFVQIHKSYIVNLDYLKGINKNEVLLFNNSRLPIGRKYRDLFYERYQEYLIK